MAKALIGYLHSDQRVSPRLGLDNQRLRGRVAELETLVLRLQAENDRLRAAQATAELEAGILEAEMLPA
ncbi:hypothetical protein [Nocardioides currus]|uniref:Uncharacterized protein n=1 Tax=Nocardioides currus TaxID=2133958 RepID=A0A2R7YWQ9_9ACTN|nr:hypothetical protein [Nocardioides currus]PUA80744.1 hypothetical protein C7S10_13430 [Nocardioides currus]